MLADDRVLHDSVADCLPSTPQTRTVASARIPRHAPATEGEATIMRNVLVISSSEWPVAALRAALGDDIDELRVVVPAVHQSRLQWLTNADDDARERADDAASSIADALPSQETEASAGDSDPLLAAEDALRDVRRRRGRRGHAPRRRGHLARTRQHPGDRSSARRSEGHSPRRERHRLAATTWLCGYGWSRMNPSRGR